MGTYWKISGIIAGIICVALFTLMMFVFGIVSCNTRNEIEDQVDNEITIRYYRTEDIDTAEVITVRAYPGGEQHCYLEYSKLPYSAGKSFKGLYSDMNGQGKQYFDNKGDLVTSIPEKDIVLYPYFESLGGANYD